MKRDNTGWLALEVFIDTEWKVFCRKCRELFSYGETSRGGCKESYRLCGKCNVSKAKAYQGEGARKSWRKTYHRNKRVHPQKVLARQLVNAAVQSGLIRKPEACACGKKGTLDGHHEDYERPLDVEWLCRGCHIKAHKNWGRPRF